jgi:hypothetical protein
LVPGSHATLRQSSASFRVSMRSPNSSCCELVPANFADRFIRHDFVQRDHRIRRPFVAVDFGRYWHFSDMPSCRHHVCFEGCGRGQ